MNSHGDTTKKNCPISRVKGRMRQVRRSVRNHAYVFSNGVLGAFNGLRKASLRVALVSSKKWKGKEYDDLLLQRTLIRAGARAEIVAFEDVSVDWTKYDRIVVRSMWGYQNEMGAFSDWMSKVQKSGAPVFNSLEIIKRNYDKAKQFEILGDLPVIPTEVMKTGSLDGTESIEDFVSGLGKQGKKIAASFPFVIKPAISASGENTFLISSLEDFSRILPKILRINVKKDLLLQSYVPEISNGELGVVMIAGKISHAVRRFPGVLTGDEYKVVLEAEKIDRELATLCERVYKNYTGALYLRVDVVRRGDSYVIMEIEAFEPALFFGLLKGDKRKKALALMTHEILRRTV